MFFESNEAVCILREIFYEYALFSGALLLFQAPFAAVFVKVKLIKVKAL